MRILLTGAGGFIGSAFMRNRGLDSYVAVDSFRHKGRFDRLDPVDLRDTPVIAHDLSVPFSPTEAADIGEVDAIVHLASESHVTRSIVDPVRTIHNNVMGTTYLLEWARTLKKKPLFLLFSTDEVYGALGVGDPPLKEWSPILPSSPYSASKAAQEAICISYWRSFGIPLIIVNCMNAYGPRQDPEKYLPMLVSCFCSGSVPAMHVNSAGVVGSRVYIHVQDVVAAVKFLLERVNPEDAVFFESNDIPPRYNIVGSEEMSNVDFARCVHDAMPERACGPFEVIYDSAPQRPGHDFRYALDGIKLAALGWRPQIPLDLGIRLTVAWYLSHTNWLIS